MTERKNARPGTSKAGQSGRPESFLALILQPSLTRSVGCHNTTTSNPTWDESMINEPNDTITGYDFKALDVRFEGDILRVTLDRPERLNAFNDDMREEFLWLTRRIEANDDIRCIVIDGAGDRAFCAGADVSWFEQD